MDAPIASALLKTMLVKAPVIDEKSRSSHQKSLPFQIQ
jgi:hypothetical protein